MSFTSCTNIVSVRQHYPVALSLIVICQDMIKQENDTDYRAAMLQCRFIVCVQPFSLCSRSMRNIPTHIKSFLKTVQTDQLVKVLHANKIQLFRFVKVRLNKYLRGQRHLRESTDKLNNPKIATNRRLQRNNIPILVANPTWPHLRQLMRLWYLSH